MPLIRVKSHSFGQIECPSHLLVPSPEIPNQAKGTKHTAMQKIKTPAPLFPSFHIIRA
jgi:hypothetical protein